jgi:TatD DNase family protein
MLIDSHTHLYLAEFAEDIDTVIKNALHGGVEKMLLPHIDSRTTDALFTLCEKYPGTCLPMMGLHPTSVNGDPEPEMKLVAGWLEKRKFVAIGEVGMDLYWDKSYKKQQEQVFEQHIAWSKQFGLPLVIHSRNAVNELLNILSKHRNENLTGVFHSFTGNLEQALAAIELGFSIGINGIITFKNSGLEKMLAGIGLANILLETDAPYLAPVPYRGKRNESAYLGLIAARIAEICGTSAEQVAAITTANSTKLFALNSYP